MKNTRWWALLVLVLAAIWLSPLAALAQQTGGSFGGSRWGSGSRPSSSSSSGSGWSRPSSSGSGWSRPSTSYGGGSSYGGGTSYSPSYGSSTGGGGAAGACCIVLFLLVIVIIVVVAQKKNGGGRAMAPFYPPAGGPMPMPPGGNNDTFAVGKLAIAFDSRARAQIQTGIAQIAERSNMGGAGLPGAARETAQLLTQHLAAAYMTETILSERLTQQTAMQFFDTAVSTERGRFIVETMRNDAGGVRKVDGPRMTARAEEGGGFVVVSLIVGRRGGFFGFQPPTNRQILAQDLTTLLQGDDNLNAMEVIWQPSDANDVMSSAEMAQVFKELRPIDPDQQVPRRACEYCKTVYAAELQTCPNCGARPSR